MMHPDTLAAALLAQSPYAELTDAEVAAALRAATVQVTVAVPWSAIRAVAQSAGDWAFIVARSRQVATLPVATFADAAIVAATHASTMEGGQTIAADDSAGWATFLRGLDVLVAAGDVTVETADAVKALRTASVTLAASIGWPGGVIWPGDVARLRKGH